MDLDYTKLGKLVAVCKENMVSKLEISDSEINVYFNEVRKSDVPLITDVTQVPLMTSDDLKEEVDKTEVVAHQRRLDEEMLHLTDPVEWERREMMSGSGDYEDTVAVGGAEDEEDGDFDV